MSVIPLSPAEVPTHLPLAQAADGEIFARMFAAPVAPKERQFVLGVAQFIAGARRTMPSKPGAMSATRAREVRERAPHAALELLAEARAASDKITDATGMIALGTILGVAFILATIYVIGITVRGEPRVCPSCDEVVRKAATVCRYCHRDL